MSNEMKQELMDEINKLKTHNIKMINSIKSFLDVEPACYGEGDIIQAQQAMRIVINGGDYDFSWKDPRKMTPKGLVNDYNDNH